MIIQNCSLCKYSNDCPCDYSLHNAACLTIAELKKDHNKAEIKHINNKFKDSSKLQKEKVINLLSDYINQMKGLPKNEN